MQVEDRSLRPHLALARAPGRLVPDRSQPDLDPLVAALTGTAGPQWSPSGVHLVRSRPGAEPAYEVSLTAALG